MNGFVATSLNPNTEKAAVAVEKQVPPTRKSAPGLPTVVPRGFVIRHQGTALLGSTVTSLSAPVLQPQNAMSDLRAVTMPTQANLLQHHGHPANPLPAS